MNTLSIEGGRELAIKNPSRQQGKFLILCNHLHSMQNIVIKNNDLMAFKKIRK